MHEKFDGVLKVLHKIQKLHEPKKIKISAVIFEEKIYLKIKIQNWKDILKN